MENLRCPHDSETLEATESSRSCPFCKGCWLPYSALEGMRYPNGQTAESYFSRLLAQSSKMTALACPTGCGFLNETEHKGLALDCCKDCGGVWFDAKELQQWVAQNPAAKSELERASAQVKSDSVAERLDDGFSFLDAFLNAFSWD